MGVAAGPSLAHRVRDSQRRAETRNPCAGGQTDGAGVGAHRHHPGTPTERGRSNTAKQDTGATPEGTGESAVAREERGSKAGEAARTAGTGHQEVEEEGACAWEAATAQGRAWPASPVARVLGQPLFNRHQVWGASRSPEGLFAQHEGEPARGRPAMRGKGMTREPQTVPHTNNSSPPRGGQVPPTTPSVPPTPPSVPLHRHCTQQGLPASPRLSGPTGGSPTPTVSARSGSSTQRANPQGPAAQHQSLPVPRGSANQWATTGALRHPLVPSVRGGDRAPRGPILGPLQRSIRVCLRPGIQPPLGHHWGP